MRERSGRLYLLYHELRPGGSRYSYVLDTAQFEEHVDLFVRLRKSNDAGLWPEVTFDDGHLSNIEFAAPILQARKLSARFFLTAGWIGKKRGFMTWSDVHALIKMDQTIGAHGWTHALLTHCSEEELHTELSTARLTLEDKLGTAITTMSLPGGRYNRRVLAACTKAGYTQVFTSEPKAELLPLGTTIGRLNIHGDMSPEWIEKLFQPQTGVLSHLQHQYRIKETAKTILGDWLYDKLWAFRNRKESDPDGSEGSAE